MDGVGKFSAEDMTRSLAGWWAAAGVDELVADEVATWFEPEASPAAPDEPPSAKADRTPIANEPLAPLPDWPQSIEQLKSMVAEGALLPGNMFGGKTVQPLGKAGARLMVISDVPDTDDAENGMLGSGASGRLLAAMLGAIGVSMDDIYWAPLATTIPSMGDLPDTALPPLAEYARHQIQLVNPKAVLLLGAGATKAMLGEELMHVRGLIRNINHDVGNKATVSTFHPRSLIARSAMKAQSWQDLQMLAKEVVL